MRSREFIIEGLGNWINDKLGRGTWSRPGDVVSGRTVSNYLDSSSPFPPVKDATDITKSPEYPDVSPAYQPTSSDIEIISENATSPVYVPSSPEYESREQTADEKMAENMKIWEEWRKYWDPKQQLMTHRYDEASKTWIKNQTYREIWGLNGGSQPDFQVGEPVYLRGGEVENGGSNYIWSIKHVGDKFITVENKDPNYSGGDDNIQVVQRHELLRPDEINPASINGEGLSFDKPMISQMSGGGRPPHHEYGTNNDGKIVFSPNIVVTTGNNNELSVPGLTSDATSIPQGVSTPVQFNGEPSVIRNISMNKMDTVMDSALDPVPKAAETTSSSSGGGLFDFAKGFFIKKMI